MKTVFPIKNKLILFSLCGLCCLYFIFTVFSCGLDTFYFLEPPTTSVIRIPSSDPVEKFFQFTTSSNLENASIFTGTSVYYRLYNSLSLLTQDVNNISNRNEIYSDKAMNYMISNGFQTLMVGDSDFIVPASDGVANVTIRPFADTGYPASVSINNKYIGIPYRYQVETPFTFYPENENIPIPESGDLDTKYSSSGGNTWYLVAYAVSIGSNMELLPVFSQVTYLGYLSISPTY